jgi:hypothetical protein
MSEEKVYSENHERSSNNGSEIDLLSFHEQNAGRLIIDPECVFTTVIAARMDSGIDRKAKIELGTAVAARLKLTKDGTKVLWPQPTDSPKDPQNWSTRRKTLQLFIITLAAIVPDFNSGIGK